MQRYKHQGNSVNYFELTNQFTSGYISNRLQEFTAYYSNRLSYTEVENLIIRTTGDKLLSDQTCRQIVINKATEFSEQLVIGVESTLSTSVEQPLIVNQNVEIYQPDSREILLFDDAIQVKAQKSKREKHTTKFDNQDGFELGKTSTSAISTDVVILQTSQGEFEYITAPLPLDNLECWSKRLSS